MRNDNSFCRNDLFNKVSVGFSEMLNHPDPEFKKNTDPFHTAFQLSYKTDVAFFGAGGWLTKDPQEAVKFGLSYEYHDHELIEADSAAIY